MTHTVTLDELKADVQKYVDEARRGNTVQVTEGEEPVVEIVAAKGFVVYRPDPWLPLGTVKLERVSPLPDGVEMLLEDRRKDRER